MGRCVDLTGERFGRLTVLKRGQNANDGHARWVCKCDCGKLAVVAGNDLKKGTSRSCGCLRLDKIDEMILKNTIHGESHSKLYSVWSNMKSRCDNPNNPEYMLYGARGISICYEWRANFQAFYTWAVDSGYSKGLSIDRIDNNKGYAPDNCRWATPREQGNNRRSNRYIELHGEVRTMAEWCRHLSLEYAMVRRRLNYGWAVEEALGLTKHIC